MIGNYIPKNYQLIIIFKPSYRSSLNPDVEIQESENSGEGQLRLRRAGRINPQQKTIHNENNRHLENGPKADRVGVDGSAPAQSYALSLHCYLQGEFYGENVPLSLYLGVFVLSWITARGATCFTRLPSRRKWECFSVKRRLLPGLCKWRLP